MNTLPDKLSFVTPCYHGDQACFSLLRESVQKFAPEIRHYVLVDTEELALIRGWVQGQANVEVIPSADLLPPRLEALRARQKTWLFSVFKRFAWRFSVDPMTFRGWKIQQLLKLHFLSKIPTPACMFLDSDICLTRPLRERDVFDEAGRLLLLETPARNLEDQLFDANTHLFFRTALTEHPSLYNYIHQAPRFLQRTGARFLVEAQATGTGWESRFCQQAFPSEYDMLGYVARTLEQGEGYALSPLPPEQWSYKVQFESDISRLSEVLATCEAEQGERGFLLVQSNLGIPVETWMERFRAFLQQA